MAPDEPRVHLPVAARRAVRQPGLLALARCATRSRAERRGGLGRGPQLALGGALDVDQQVHPVEQRPAQPPAVAAQVRLAAPAAVADAGEPARARVRRRDEHEPRREHQRVLAAHDRHAPVLERLAQRVERRPLELGELVEKQDAVMGERRLAGPRRRSAAHQPGRRDRVVRRAERPRVHEAGGVQPRDAVDPRHLDRLGPAHRRQDRRDPPREHRLAGPRRALEQQVVAAGGGDLERQQRGGVAPDVGQVGLGRRAGASVGRRCRQRWRGRPREHLRRGSQARHPGDLESFHERRLARPLARDDQTRQAGAARSLGDGQRPW